MPDGCIKIPSKYSGEQVEPVEPVVPVKIGKMSDLVFYGQTGSTG
jgi:hypothetical protein